MTDSDPPPDRELVGTLELREERLTISRRRELSGQVEVRRERRVRTETVTIDLVSEVLVLSVKAGAGTVMVDGLPLEPGTVRELELYREEAVPGKEVVVTQDIDLVRERVVQTTTQQIELAYEELVVTTPDRPE
ncbi:DUF2382 domain-containing protein [uncultured Deinococcus sp.]|uniref:DUF2382 domain-containing protein n=1 Tax=uncultured Deinococcus sp. TaxID=158789 RepID=UPI0025E43238|nr:DUF2382 domain-containing protein [uncultured Deinococcus sp.]